MPQFTITMNDAEAKALATDMLSIEEWLNWAVHNKARRLIDEIIGKVDDRQPKKIPVEEKYQMIMDMKLETGAEKNARLELETAKLTLGGVISEFE